MDIRGYLGIDFGTANSHFAYCELAESRPRATAIPLDGADGGPAVPSYLLWERNGSGERRAKAYGKPAVDEYLLADGEEAANYMLMGAFKPDLATSGLSRDTAREFLALARSNMLDTRCPPGLGGEPGWDIVIGVPANISEAHRSATQQAASAAGFLRVACLEEPLGAVGYHLGLGQIDERDLERGVLVVDFGGGTLDVASVDRSGVREPWGDPRLGGRLFDDLFFQWVLEANSINPGDYGTTELLFIWWQECRKLKESFSRHWKRQLAQGETAWSGFKGRVEGREGSFGALRNVGLDEFLERARAYQPSALARAYFTKIDSPLKDFAQQGPVDLLGWIREVLAAGREHRCGVAILTGGSSSWPFMPGLIGELFGDVQVLAPNQPECTIGEGLAIYHALRRQYRGRQQAALEHLPALNQALDQVVNSAAKRAENDIANEIVGAIMAIARREFHAWRNRGGRLADVEHRVAAQCQRIPAQEMARKRLRQLLPEIEHDGSEAVRSWLAQQDIRGDFDGLRLGAEIDVRELRLSISLADALTEEAVGQASKIVAVTIVGGLMTVIAATSVTLAASPLAFLALPAIIGVFSARDTIKDKLLDYAFSGDALNWLQKLYPPEKLDEGLRKAEQSCRAKVAAVVRDAMREVRCTLDPLVESARQEVLKRYGLLDAMSRMPAADPVADRGEEV